MSVPSLNSFQMVLERVLNSGNSITLSKSSMLFRSFVQMPCLKESFLGANVPVNNRSAHAPGSIIVPYILWFMKSKIFTFTYPIFHSKIQEILNFTKIFTFKIFEHGYFLITRNPRVINLN